MTSLVCAIYLSLMFFLNSRNLTILKNLNFLNKIIRIIFFAMINFLLKISGFVMSLNYVLICMFKVHIYFSYNTK